MSRSCDKFTERQRQVTVQHLNFIDQTGVKYREAVNRANAKGKEQTDEGIQDIQTEGRRDCSITGRVKTSPVFSLYLLYLCSVTWKTKYTLFQLYDCTYQDKQKSSGSYQVLRLGDFNCSCLFVSLLSVSRTCRGSAVDIWTQTQPNPMKQSKRSSHAYPDRIHHPNKQDNYSLWTEPKKKCDCQTIHLRASAEIFMLHLLMIPLTTPTFPSLPSHLSRQTESLKRVHLPLTLTQPRPVAPPHDVLRPWRASRLVSGTRPVSHLCPALPWP